MVDSPVKIDISLKANVDLPMPTDAVGRLVNALADAISPFTEKQGLKADMVRLQRAEVAIEIAQRRKSLLRFLVSLCSLFQIRCLFRFWRKLP